MNLRRLLRLFALVPYQLSNLLMCVAGLAWFRLSGARRIQHRGLGARARRVVMLSYVAVRYDPRIRRAATALAAAGYHVTVIKPADAEPDVDDDAIGWHERICFISMGRAGTASYFPWCFDWRMYRAVVTADAGVVHCHDANTCLMGVLAAARLKSAFVADFHEWFSEHGSTNVSGNFGYAGHARTKRWIFRGIERLVAQSATVLITVSQSLGEAMQKSLGIDRGFLIIRNVPGEEQNLDLSVDFRRELGIPEHQFLLLHIGLLNPTRNLEQLIRALADVPNVTFIIRGTGIEQYGPIWQELAVEQGVADRVIFLPPVASDQMIAQCRAADAGFFNVANVSLNYRYALPNKIFEYLYAGIPFLAVAIPEILRLVDELEAGEVFEANDGDSIVRALRRLAGDRANYVRLRSSAERAREKLLAHPEWNKLVASYADFA